MDPIPFITTGVSGNTFNVENGAIKILEEETRWNY